MFERPGRDGRAWTAISISDTTGPTGLNAKGGSQGRRQAGGRRNAPFSRNAPAPAGLRHSGHRAPGDAQMQAPILGGPRTTAGRRRASPASVNARHPKVLMVVPKRRCEAGHTRRLIYAFKWRVPVDEPALGPAAFLRERATRRGRAPQRPRAATGDQALLVTPPLIAGLRNDQGRCRSSAAEMTATTIADSRTQQGGAGARRAALLPKMSGGNRKTITARPRQRAGPTGQRCWPPDRRPGNRSGPGGGQAGGTIA